MISQSYESHKKTKQKKNKQLKQKTTLLVQPWLALHFFFFCNCVFVLSPVNLAFLVISLVRLAIAVVLNVGELRSVRCYRRGLQSQVEV
jgi:uncharacterized protein YqhQ